MVIYKRAFNVSGSNAGSFYLPTDLDATLKHIKDTCIDGISRIRRSLTSNMVLEFELGELSFIPRKPGMFPQTMTSLPSLRFSSIGGDIRCEFDRLRDTTRGAIMRQMRGPTTDIRRFIRFRVHDERIGMVHIVRISLWQTRPFRACCLIELIFLLGNGFRNQPRSSDDT